jgi:hypothetical protein
VAADPRITCTSAACRTGAGRRGRTAETAGERNTVVVAGRAECDGVPLTRGYW